MEYENEDKVECNQLHPDIWQAIVASKDKRYMTDALPQMHFHTLRHTFATRCIESNCDVKTVSSILGHTNISTTLNVYVHPNMEHKRKCIDQMLESLRQ